MAKNVYQVRQAFLYSALICFVLLLFIIWIAILIRTQNSSFAMEDVFPHIVEHHASVGMAGLLLVGLMAMIMSTADSNLNTAAVIFSNDMVGSTIISRVWSFLKLAQSDKNRLIIARVSSVVLGIISLLFALHSDSYLYTKIVLGAWGYYMLVVSVPFLMTLLGFRSTTRVILIGMASGFITVFLWDYFFPMLLLMVICPAC
jgi:Na+/proline symporter